MEITIPIKLTIQHPVLPQRNNVRVIIKFPNQENKWVFYDLRPDQVNPKIIAELLLKRLPAIDDYKKAEKYLNTASTPEIEVK
tara:strand:- start:537 stop:785 length:249 start_codon:yes stop_codon:yes gene_type:complete